MHHPFGWIFGLISPFSASIAACISAAPAGFSGWESQPVAIRLPPFVTTVSPLRLRIGDPLSPDSKPPTAATPCSRLGAASVPRRHHYVTTHANRAKKLRPRVHFYAYPPRIVGISDFLPPDWMPTIAYPI